MAMPVDPRADLAVVADTGCDYCGDFTGATVADATVETSWHTVTGYDARPARAGDDVKPEELAFGADAGCDYCADFSQTERTPVLVASSWKPGLGYNAAPTMRAGWFW